MIALSSYSTSWSKNESHTSFTGGLLGDTTINDSVLIAYSDLRIVNVKLIDLKYQKEINKKLTEIIYNDSLIIANKDIIINEKDKVIKKHKKEKNIAIGSGIGVLILLILSLIK